MSCMATNARGEPCQAPDHMTDGSGFCPSHREGSKERLRAAAAKGGEATKAKYAMEAFTAEQLSPIRSLEDAKLALDEIRVAVMTRRLAHAEGNAASKAVAEWIKAEGAATTARLVNELRTELDLRLREIEELRAQLAGKAKPIRMAR
jgi:hypothetical protein